MAKTPDKNDQVIVAFFNSQDAGDAAVADLQAWDQATEEIKLGAVGTIRKDGDKVKTNVGRKTGKGAKVGTVIGIIAAILSGGVTLIGGLVVGSAGGGIVGAFMKKSTNLTKEEIAQIGTELDAGRVAVIVTCDDFELEATRQRLLDAGGTVRNYEVPQEAYDDAAQAVEGADPAAVEESPEEVITAALDEAAEENPAIEDESVAPEGDEGVAPEGDEGQPKAA